MSKEEFTIQEVVEAMLSRIKKLEMAAFEQKIINQIHESIIGSLIVYLPEPQKLDGIWRTLGSDMAGDLVERYAGQSPELQQVVNKVLAEHMNFPKAVLNEAILMREDTDSKVEPE